MKIPPHDEIINISTVLPILKEMLDYCALEACERNQLSYDGDLDEVTYHHKPNSLDLSLFDVLYGVEEIWIVTKGCSES